MTPITSTRSELQAYLLELQLKTDEGRVQGAIARDLVSHWEDLATETLDAINELDREEADQCLNAQPIRLRLSVHPALPPSRVRLKQPPRVRMGGGVAGRASLKLSDTQIRITGGEHFRFQAIHRSLKSFAVLHDNLLILRQVREVCDIIAYLGLAEVYRIARLEHHPCEISRSLQHLQFAIACSLFLTGKYNAVYLGSDSAIFTHFAFPLFAFSRFSIRANLTFALPPLLRSPLS